MGQSMLRGRPLENWGGVGVFVKKIKSFQNLVKKNISISFQVKKKKYVIILVKKIYHRVKKNILLAALVKKSIRRPDFVKKNNAPNEKDYCKSRNFR